VSELGGLVLLVGLVALGATGALAAACLRLRSAVSYVLAAYLIAWAEIVVVTFALTPGRWIHRSTLLVAYLAILVATLAVWLARGRPRAPAITNAARNGLEAAADPLVAVPLLASAASLVYSLVVTLTTPPNDGDPLAYELARAAFWRQEQGVVILEDAHDLRLNYSPPIAESGDLTLMTLAGTDQFVGLAQWFAVLMLALATYGVGRRIGLERRPALWGASLVPLFPVVLAQSWTSFTDLVFGSFAVSAVYFGIGSLGVELVLLGLAIALAFGTKFLGPIFAPMFVLILALAQPRCLWFRLAAVFLAGAAVASLWYLRTQLEAGDPVGNSGAGLQSREIAPVVTTFTRLSVEVFDLTGAAGRDQWLYTVAAVILGAIALAYFLRGGRPSFMLGAAAVLVFEVPYIVEGLGRAYAWMGTEVGAALGRADLVEPLRDWHASVVSDGAFSWYGPVGAMLAIFGIPIAVSEIRRRRLSRTAVALAAAPIIAIALVSITITYERYEGRYFVSAFALSATIWGGFALRHRWVGATAVCLAATTAVLTLVNSLGKPSGITVFRGDPGRSVWSMPRWEQQGILRPTTPERDEVMTMRFVDDRVPDDASLGLALAFNSFSFPYFGRELRRTVTLVGEGDPVTADVDWLVAAPEREPVGCRAAWSLDRRGSYGWRVWHRTGPDTCSAVEPLR
jgi:hypothetical protein